MSADKKNYDIEPSYTFEKHEFENGVFDNSCDATYIIHLEGNGRYDKIIKNMNELITTKIVYIVKSKGYKNISKNYSYINTVSKDISFTNITIFKHSSNCNYKNILIFEDDYFYDEKIQNRNTTNEINKFVNQKTLENETFIYYLGCIPPIMKVNCKHNLLISVCTSHSIIFSQKCITYFLSNLENLNHTLYGNEYRMWDLFLNENKIIIKYCNNKCLVYKKFEYTENMKNFWVQDNIPSFFLKNKILSSFAKNIATPIAIDILKFSSENIDSKNIFDLMYLLCKKI